MQLLKRLVLCLCISSAVQETVKYRALHWNVDCATHCSLQSPMVKSMKCLQELHSLCEEFVGGQNCSSIDHFHTNSILHKD